MFSGDVPANTRVIPKSLTIERDGPSRMVKRPTGSGGEPSSPNCGVSAGVKARHLIHLKSAFLAGFVSRAAFRCDFVSLECVTLFSL